MDNFSYCTPTQYYFGKGVEDKAGVLSAERLGSRVLLVYGQGSVVKSGLLGRIEESLRQAGVEFVHLGGIKPNPDDVPVYEGINLCREKEVTGILAVGGGSVIDTAKAVAAGVPYDGDFWDFFAGKARVVEALPVGVVLTIPAAGSEGSGNAVITKTEGKVKVGVRTEWQLRPRFALLNPELTFTLPPYQTAAGIADMMAHIMERYFTPTADVEVTDRISEGLLKAIIEESPKVMANPTDYQARANIMWSGTLAHNGICGCGRAEDWSSHAVEHELSALYGVTHGAGLAVAFPAWMTVAAQTKPEKIAQFARRVFDIVELDDQKAAAAGIQALKDFFSNVLHLPITLAQLGITDLDLDAIVAKLHQTKGPQFGAYITLTPAISRQIYQLMA